MDDKMITDVLHEITEQEIPDTMQSLWPVVQRKLTGPRRVDPWMRNTSRLGWVTLVVTPRKNGKTVVAAGIGLYLLTMDEEGLWRRKNRNIPLKEVYARLSAAERIPSMVSSIGVLLNFISLTYNMFG